MLSYVMPFGLVYGRSSARSRLRRRSSAGSMPLIARGDVEQHLARQRLELPRTAVRGAPGGVRVDGLAEKLAFGTRYGPGNSAPTAAAVITGHGVGYAPQSDVKSMPTAWMMPSPSSAMRTSAASRRDLPAASRFSRRSSIHFTGAPST